MKIPDETHKNISAAADMVDQWLQSERRATISSEQEAEEGLEEISSNIVAAGFWPSALRLYLHEAIEVVHLNDGRILLDSGVCLATLFGYGFAIERGVKNSPRGSKAICKSEWRTAVEANMIGDGKGYTDYPGLIFDDDQLPFHLQKSMGTNGLLALEDADSGQGGKGKGILDLPRGGVAAKGARVLKRVLSAPERVHGTAQVLQPDQRVLPAPEQHAVNKNTGQYYCGSDARLWRIDVPDGARFTDPDTGVKKIRCRICNKTAYDYDDDLHNLHAYYPHRNVFTVPLKSSGDDHYLFAVHPHGVLALSMAPTFAEGTGLETTLLMANEEDFSSSGDDQPKKNHLSAGSGPPPNKNAPEGLAVPEPMVENLPAPADQPKKTASDEEEKNQVLCCTVDAAFYLPFAGEWAQLAGLTTAVKEKMVTNLEAKKSVGIYVGGADEALLAGGGKMRVLLKDRMGFVEVALRTNTPLVPVLVFGETALYRQVFHPRLRQFQHSMMKKLSFSLPAFRGEESGWNPLLPKQTPLHTVFGAPIPMPPCPGGGKWTKETPGFREAVRAVHALYVQRLKELHAQWKHLGTAEDQELEIVSLAEAQSEDMLEQLREGQKRMDELKREGQYELPGPRDILDYEQGTDGRKIKRIFRSKL
eukprot:g9223.t1